RLWVRVASISRVTSSPSTIDPVTSTAAERPSSGSDRAENVVHPSVAPGAGLRARKEIILPINSSTAAPHDKTYRQDYRTVSAADNASLPAVLRPQDRRLEALLHLEIRGTPARSAPQDPAERSPFGEPDTRCSRAHSRYLQGTSLGA